MPRPTLFFFFSSRRRHTILVSDWSSDVCSSDLQQPERTDAVGTEADLHPADELPLPQGEIRDAGEERQHDAQDQDRVLHQHPGERTPLRTEPGGPEAGPEVEHRRHARSIETAPK